ncbi:unnamed protein product [Rotaria sp. Silwood1]|nr:unnamed protein product [Rotaria sp. Silwood1]CAF1371766.1 unnamed protein product [Rotaria sp. Silwood1]CAF3575221.1 unnamed protein product [Rotaria sp. Silwood1]CAF3600640.1 unnamed protein product [Rotaria sp. Silwood1]CAF4740856.1 unnamed protein product [Rotaria sp. Silwood1]
MGNRAFYKRAPSSDIQGIASTNVPAYSNHGTYSFRENYLYGVYTGVQWQCVEFARRWLLLRKSCTFSDVDIAANIWTNIPYVERVTDGKKLSLIAHPNGSKKKPQKDSFLIYPRSRRMYVGHIAVITNVDQNYVYIAEQNHEFHYWSADYARRAPLIFTDNGYFIDDDYKLYGWMEIEGNEQLQPLNESTIPRILRKYQTSDE